LVYNDFVNIDRLIQEFDNQKVIKNKNRDILDCSLFDHSRLTDPLLLQQAVNVLIDFIKWDQLGEITAIVSEEECGGFLAVCVALQKKIPFTLAKQNPVHLPGEIGIKFSMSYNRSMSLYLNGLKENNKVIIIDDIIDTGGTMIALIKALGIAKVKIIDIVALAEKVNVGGIKKIKQKTGYDVRTIIKVDTSTDRSKVVSINL